MLYDATIVNWGSQLDRSLGLASEVDTCLRYYTARRERSVAEKEGVGTMTASSLVDVALDTADAS